MFRDQFLRQYRCWVVVAIGVICSSIAGASSVRWTADGGRSEEYRGHHVWHLEGHQACRLSAQGVWGPVQQTSELRIELAAQRRTMLRLEVVYQDGSRRWTSVPFQTQPLTEDWHEYQIVLASMEAPEPDLDIVPKQSIVKIMLEFHPEQNLLWGYSGWVRVGTPRIATPNSPRQTVGAFRVRPDGSQRQQLGPEEYSIVQVEAAPDGQMLVCSVIRADTNDDGVLDPEDDQTMSEIAIMRPDGSGFQFITLNAAPDTAPTFSPDGTKVLFSGHPDGRVHDMRDLLVYDLTTQQLDNATSTRSSDEVDPYWSKTGVVVFADLAPDTAGLWVSDPQFKHRRQLTRARSRAYDRYPRVSASGQRVVFTRQKTNIDGKTSADVFVIRIDGSQLLQLTSSSTGVQYDSSPVWWDNSEQEVLFCRTDRLFAKGGVYRLLATTAEIKPINEVLLGGEPILRCSWMRDESGEPWILYSQWVTRPSLFGVDSTR